MFHVFSLSTVYLEDSFIKSGVFSVSELVRVSRSKYRPCGNPPYSWSLSEGSVTILHIVGSVKTKQGAAVLQ